MKTRNHVSVLLVALGGTAFAAACADSIGPESAMLALNRAKWSAQGIDTYTFDYHRSSCECLPEWLEPVRITVVDGQVTSVIKIATGEAVPAPAFRLTIDSLFVELANTLKGNPCRLTVSYDGRRGYPTTVSVDYDKQMVDDEGGFFARLVSP
jgi:hypothetical protein